MPIDTHIHLDSKEYSADLDDVIKRAENAGIKYFINPGSDVKSISRINEICKTYSQIIPAYGIHPHDAKYFSEEIGILLENSITQNNACAIGETGLDYHYNLSDPDIQKKVFKQHIKLAKKYKLPLIIHSRNSEVDFFNIINEENYFNGVIHCFSGDLYWAEKFISLGFFLGITGVITFKKAHELKNIVSKLPLSSFLPETDGPFLTPIPFRGKRNESSFIPLIIDEIAKIKNLPVDLVSEQLLKNSSKLFSKIF